MALIISTQAAADFTHDGVSTATVTQLLSQLTQSLQTIQSKLSVNYSLQKAPNMPPGLTESAAQLWQSEWVSQQQAITTGSVDGLQITIFSCIWSLLGLSASSTASYADIVDQLTATLTSAGDTVALAFLNDCITL